jgi:hypothetical protein
VKLAETAADFLKRSDADAELLTGMQLSTLGFARLTSIAFALASMTLQVTGDTG